MFTLNEIQIPFKADVTGFTNIVEVTLWKVTGSNCFYPTKIAAEEAAKAQNKSYGHIYFERFYSEEK